MKSLVTGAAGFIGFHTSLQMLELGYEVIGIDNINDYYDVNLKNNRLKILQQYDKFTFQKQNLEDKEEIDRVFKKNNPNRVIHLAAQAGVRHSIKHPEEALEFAKAWGRGIDDETNQKFVTMYVNDRTIDYKPEGRASIRRFLKEGKEIGLINPEFSEDSMEFIGASEE